MGTLTTAIFTLKVRTMGAFSFKKTNGRNRKWMVSEGSYKDPILKKANRFIFPKIELYR
jgi:hypothetical protein